MCIRSHPDIAQMVRAADCRCANSHQQVPGSTPGVRTRFSNQLCALLCICPSFFCSGGSWTCTHLLGFQDMLDTHTLTSDSHQTASFQKFHVSAQHVCLYPSLSSSQSRPLSQSDNTCPVVSHEPTCKRWLLHPLMVINGQWVDNATELLERVLLLPVTWEYLAKHYQMQVCCARCC